MGENLGDLREFLTPTIKVLGHTMSPFLMIKLSQAFKKVSNKRLL